MPRLLRLVYWSHFVFGALTLASCSLDTWSASRPMLLYAVRVGWSAAPRALIMWLLCSQKRWGRPVVVIAACVSPIVGFGAIWYSARSYGLGDDFPSLWIRAVTVRGYYTLVALPALTIHAVTRRLRDLVRRRTDAGPRRRVLTLCGPPVPESSYEYRRPFAPVLA